MTVEQESRDQLRRAAVGVLCRVWRDSQGLSTRAAAQRVGVAHSTWRLVEHGNPGRPKTYRAIERAAGLPGGLIYRALADDTALVELAGRLGIEVPEDREQWPSFVNSYALPALWTRQRAESVQPRDDLEVAAELLRRLSARQQRSEVENEALAAVHALIGEWAGVSNT